MARIKPEVIFLRPVNGENRVVIAWQCLMVELGIHFSFDDKYQLPERLPPDLRGVKLILIDEKSWDHYQSAQLKSYVANGGLVFKVETPEPWSITDETVVRNPLEMMAASAGLTIPHPAIRRRLQQRSLRQLFDELHNFFMTQLNGWRQRPNEVIWSEPYAFGYLHNLELFHEYDPGGGWLKLLDEQLDFLVRERNCPALNLDYLPAMEVFMRASQRTGDPRFKVFARDRVAHAVQHADKVAGIPVLQSQRDKLLWNECIAMLAPSAVATGEKRFIDLALKTVEKVREYCYDPKHKLWYHAGRRGYHTPAFWGRGQGWALIGLTGILRNLPAEHRARAQIAGYVREIFEGLARVQDSEGMWHNVLDNPESRSEFRCTCMFVWCLAEAQRHGWLKDKRLDPVLERGWRAIRGRVWKDRACSVVWATGASATCQFYLSRPHIHNGVADALHAGIACELARRPSGHSRQPVTSC